MSVLNENTIIGASAAGEYEIEQSLRFNDNDSAYLSRTLSTPTNRDIYTYSSWVKRGVVGSAQYMFFGYSANNDQNFTALFFESNDTLKVGGYSDDMLVSTQLFRDPSAWYHIIMSVDTTQSTQSNRIKMYVNGEAMPYTVAGSFPTQNEDTGINGAHTHSISGRQPFDSAYPFDGYLAEVNFIDGQALTPDSFGETGTYGEWRPTKYAGTYGTNGFYLKFENASSLGNDAAGSNNWTPSNLAATDQMVDSPTNNFCTLNPLDKVDSVLAEGNLKATGAGDSFDTVRSTFAMPYGSWYAEFYCKAGSANGNNHVGISTQSEALSGISGSNFLGSSSTSWSYSDNGNVYSGGSVVNSTGTTWTAGDIIGVTFTGTALKFYKNNSLIATVSSIPVNDYCFTSTSYSTSMSMIADFGSDSSFAGNKTPQGNQDANGIGDFYYAPPTGYLALCTANLPDVDVIPSEHFNTVLYTGNATARSIAGLDFQPDLTWIKARSATYQHTLVDSIRGTGNWLESNATAAEQTGGAPNAFNSDGFGLTTWGQVNGSGQTYAAWNWKAGGTAVSNTNGSITSSVSANPSAGFSIVSWTSDGSNGLAVGHGLASAPQLIIYKPRNAVNEWYTWLNALVDSSQDYVRLNSTAAKVDINSAVSGVPSSTLISNFGFANTNTMIAYAFHSVDGYSKVGSYTGNGSADGPFVHCGFRPAFVMVKRTNSAQDWTLFDNTRNPANATNLYLHPNSSAADGSGIGDGIDLVSNGFKMRHQANVINNSGSPYIFLAFAESPFKHSNAR